ncbi:SipW-dependent-type signal peptide-containing protein [Salinigranum salinum]|jgi:predicted ribosomally synthesized peptide with SipW-like signal peptide|uniref:SipW-dependent-type signal peptide-containing protein n=1 Tax=Salinigranum salinum TaxID=1364937 RepID=UPI001260BE75|nr:SipW-dependent-type signal peptide-containing protein [Salinigranum salinum]
MEDDNSDSFKLSRRKALAGMGSIGLAGALGIGGTYAQFSDTEERAITFTAGGIDGQLEWSGSYNGEHIDSDTSHVTLEPSDALDTGDTSGMTADTGGLYGENSIPIDVHFDDVKPGDYGCVNFTLTVQDNEAWVASKMNVLENVDYKNYEPEIAADGNVTQTNVDNSGALNASALDADGEVVGEAATQGDLAQNIYTIPYYDSDDSCQFFDGSGFDAQGYNGATAGSFWSNSQEDGSSGFTAQDDVPEDQDDIVAGQEYYLAPRSVLDVSQNVNAIGTAFWNSDDFTLGYDTAPNGSTIAKGSTMLDGSVPARSDSGNNTQGVAPLPPGTELNFGYDFHIPFGTGNEAQGDRCSISLEFLFLQSRHTDAPDFTSYAPGQNTQQDSS